MVRKDKSNKTKKEDVGSSFFRANHILTHNPDLLLELTKNPEKILKKYGISESDLKCPSEAHVAFSKGSKIATEVKKSKDPNPIKAINLASKEAYKIFGRDYSVKKTPFGILYSEKAKSIGPLGWTATGTYEVTFGIDHGPDVDG